MNLTKRAIGLSYAFGQNTAKLIRKQDNTLDKLKTVKNKCIYPAASLQKREFCCNCKEPSFLREKLNVVLLKRCYSDQTNNNTPPTTRALAFVEYRNGLPVIHVPLPSRKEECLFILRPVVTTVSKFIEDMKNEDKGIDRAAIYTTDNFRIAGSTPMETVLGANFNIQINDYIFPVHPPESENPRNVLNDAGELRRLIGHLYSQLNVDDFKLQKEMEIKERIGTINEQLLPLQKHHAELSQKATKRTHYLMWGGLGWMSVQFGLLARLTWWEYSWDIMEPVTYFVTYGTTIIMYGYFLLTKQDYTYPDARDRQYLISLHKAAESSDFSIHKYNSLMEQLADAEKELERLRDPVHLKLPTETTG